MKYLIASFLICFAGIPLVLAEEPIVPSPTVAVVDEGPINVDDPLSLEDIKAFEARSNEMSDIIMSCMSDKKSNQECLCENMANVRAYQAHLAQLFEKYPAWKDKAVYYPEGSGLGATTFFIGHQRQSTMFDTLVCEEE